MSGDTASIVLERRGFLVLAGSALAAGCVGGASTGEQNGTPTDTPTESGSEFYRGLHDSHLDKKIELTPVERQKVVPGCDWKITATAKNVANYHLDAGIQLTVYLQRGSQIVGTATKQLRGLAAGDSQTLTLTANNPGVCGDIDGFELGAHW